MNIDGMTSKKVFQGFYGDYEITPDDELEVKKYRISLAISSVSFVLLIAQWILLGSDLAWIWIVPMVTAIGFALKWIHIYIIVLHRLLQVFWLIGVLGIIFLSTKYGIQNILNILESSPIFVIAIGPLFVALTGLGFKEFFCFRRIEAIGLTILLPISILGLISNLISPQIVISMLFIASILMLIMSIRKFGTEASADIGDKSIFEKLKNN